MKHASSITIYVNSIAIPINGHSPKSRSYCKVFRFVAPPTPIDNQHSPYTTYTRPDHHQVRQLPLTLHPHGSLPPRPSSQITDFVRELLPHSPPSQCVSSRNTPHPKLLILLVHTIARTCDEYCPVTIHFGTLYMYALRIFCRASRDIVDQTTLAT
jgi:hypothetical protein